MELQDDCLYGFGVCAKSDANYSTNFAHVLEILSPYLVELNESECEDEELHLRDIAIGALFKIAIYQPSPHSISILDSCFHYFPLAGDRFTAQEIHYSFLKLLLSGHQLLVDESSELLKTSLIICLKINEMNEELQKDLMEEVSCQHEWDEAYEEQCMCYQVTRDDIKFLMKSRYIEGVDKGRMQRIIQATPELWGGYGSS